MTRTHTKLWIALATFTLSLLSSSGVAANEEIYQRTLRSTVWIVGEAPKENPAEGESKTNIIVGTGFIVDKDRGYIVTNFHVVGTLRKVFVFYPEFQDGEVISTVDHYVDKFKVDPDQFTGNVLLTSSKRDLALVQAVNVPGYMEEMRLADSSPRPGQVLHSIGSSGAVRAAVLWRYNEGKVGSVYRRTWKTEKTWFGKNLELQAQVIEAQIPSSPGDSGGPVVNDRGELVGVKQGHDTEAQLVTFNIDVSEVKRLMSFAPDRRQAQAAAGQ